ncbi:MAG: hypothetical protein AB1736_07325 [Chloroflexota bacterium]
MAASRRPGGTGVRLIVGIAGPLAMFALLFALWLTSDRLVKIGPLDRGLFFWLVLLPLWCLSPALAALGWRRLGPGVDRPAAVVLGLVLAVVAAAILWSAGTADQATCEHGPRTPAPGLILPMGIVGVVIGSGWAFCALVASSLIARGRTGRGIGLGVALMFAAFIVAVIATGAVIMVAGGCNRPPA